MPDQRLVDAAREYNVPLGVLEGIAATEGISWDTVNPDEGSVGRFQIHPTHAAVIKERFGIEWSELRSRPDIQILFHAPRLAQAWNEAKDRGASDEEAAWAVVILQAPAMEYRQRQFESIMRELGHPGPYPPPPMSPTVTGPEPTETGDIPMPKLGDYTDVYSGRTDWEGYYLALDARQKLQEGGAVGPDEIDYINASINLIAAQGAAVGLDIQKADLELQKRLGALEEAGRTYRELAPYSLPEGTEWIPGGEPGGLYEQMGMGTMPAQTTRINPLATALATMGRTPEMAPTPDTSFEAAIAGGRQLREGMGAAPTAPPSHLESALATAGAGEIAPEPQLGPGSEEWLAAQTKEAPGQMGIFQLVLAMAAEMAERAGEAGLEMEMSEDDKIRLGRILQQVIGKDVELSEWMAQPAGAAWDVLKRIRP